jgi:hypothetical protein
VLLHVAHRRPGYRRFSASKVIRFIGIDIAGAGHKTTALLGILVSRQSGIATSGVLFSRPAPCLIRVKWPVWAPRR